MAATIAEPAGIDVGMLPLATGLAPAAVATVSAVYFSVYAPNLSLRVAIFSALAALPMGPTR